MKELKYQHFSTCLIIIRFWNKEGLNWTSYYISYKLFDLSSQATALQNTCPVVYYTDQIESHLKNFIKN